MADVSLLISALAIIFSAVAVVLTAMKEGIGLALGFRESEETQTKLKRINDQMKKEIDEETLDFLKKNGNKKSMDEEIKNGILDVSANMLYDVLGAKLLEEMANTAKRFLKRVFITALMLVVIIVYFYVYSSLGLISEATLTFGLIYVLLASILGYLTIIDVRIYYDIRLAFQKLSENPSCEKCEEIVKELKGKGVREFERFIGVIE